MEAATINYYKRHLGDLAKSCGHLSQGAMGAYDLLIDWCYSNERPLPKRRQELYLIGRAMTKAERENVDRVVAEFFTETDEGFTQKRIGEELAAYAERCETNRRTGRLGGRPKVPRGTTETETESVSETVSEQEPRNNPSQNPIAIKQELPIPQAPENSKARAPTQAGEACRLMRQAGCTQTNPGHPDLLAAIAEGVTPQTLADTVREGIDAGKGNPFTWAIATARGRHAQGPRPVAAGPPHADATQHRMSKTALGIAALEDLKRETLDRMATGGNPDRPAEARLLVAGSDTSG